MPVVPMLLRERERQGGFSSTKHPKLRRLAEQFISKRARPDAQLAIAFLCARVKNPTKQDSEKSHRMMSFLWWTKDKCLMLEMDDSGAIEWHVDASFAANSDMRSHAGATLLMGTGATESASSKQKTNTRSSVNAEMAAVDDVIAQGRMAEQGIVG